MMERAVTPTSPHLSASTDNTQPHTDVPVAVTAEAVPVAAAADQPPAELSRFRRVWRAVNPVAHAIAWGANVAANSWGYELPFLGKYVLYPMKKYLPPLSQAVMGTASGGMTTYLRNKIHPGYEVDVPMPVHVVDHVVACSAVGMATPAFLTATAGASFVAGPFGMMTMVAVNTVAGPILAKGLDKVMQTVGPSVKGCFAAVGHRVHDSYTSLRDRHRQVLPIVALHDSPKPGEADDENQPLVHEEKRGFLARLCRRGN